MNFIPKKKKKNFIAIKINNKFLKNKKSKTLELSLSYLFQLLLFYYESN